LPPAPTLVPTLPPAPTAPLELDPVVLVAAMSPPAPVALLDEADELPPPVPDVPPPAPAEPPVPVLSVTVPPQAGVSPSAAKNIVVQRSVRTRSLMGRGYSKFQARLASS
jgi:hypothetical protein